MIAERGPAGRVVVAPSLPARLWHRVYSDFLMPSRMDDYRALLETVQAAGYEIVSVENFWGRVTAGGTPDRTMILRHDVDTDPATAGEMCRVDESLGVHGSYFFRLSTLDVALASAIAATGAHVGYHYEELATVAKARHARRRADAVSLVPQARAAFARNLAVLRAATGLPMRVVASHGDFANRAVEITNSILLDDVAFRRELAVDLEVYDEAYLRRIDSRHSDTHHPTYWLPASPIEAVLAGTPVVELLVHPRHWRSSPALNARDDAHRLWAGVRFALPTPFDRPPQSAGRAGAGPPPDEAVERPLVRAPATQAGATLVIGVPDGREAERRYVMDVVLREWLGLPFDLLRGIGPAWTIGLAGDPHGRRVSLPDVLLSTPPDRWLTEQTLPGPPFARVLLPGGASDRIPVLYGAVGDGEVPWRATEAGLDLAVDVFGSVFFELSRYEELARPDADSHGRYRAAASVAGTSGFVGRPVADQLTDLLWTAISATWPGLSRKPAPFRLRLTHDVDEIWAAHRRPPRSVIRGIVGDVIRRHDPRLAAERMRAALPPAAGRLERDPFNTFDHLMDVSERHGLTSTFYIVAGGRHRLDGRYDVRNADVRRLLRRIHDRGHEVGLHASYASCASAPIIAAELATLRDACRRAGFDQPAWGVRHHYLRVVVPATWRAHEAAGVEHDSSLGYADEAGFRAGTSREFPLFDLPEGRALAVRERPLVVMDRTLFGYLRLDEDEAARQTRAIVAACRAHGGDAVLLFHNNFPVGRRRGYYEALVASLLRSG